MEILHSILQVAIWFLAIPLVILILLQGGAGDMSSTFGGGGQLDSTLGVGASRKMGKITAIMAIAFMVSVLVLNVPATGGPIGGAQGAPASQSDKQPATTAPAAQPSVEVAQPPAEVKAPTVAEQPPAVVEQPPTVVQPPAETPAQATPPVATPPPAETTPESKAAIDLGQPAEAGN